MNETEMAAEKIAGDMNALMQDAEALLQATEGHSDSKVAEIRRRLVAAMSQARASCIDLRNKASEQVRQGLEVTDATVRAHPWESVGLAFAVGLLVGVLVKRR